MEYGPNYAIFKLAEYLKKYLVLLDKTDIQFFTIDNLPYDRRDFLCAIQVGKGLNLDDWVPVVSHPAIHSAVNGYDLYATKISSGEFGTDEFHGRILYDNMIWLVNSIIDLMFDVYSRKIEEKVDSSNPIKSVKFLMVERQKDHYKNTHPTKFVEMYQSYLDKRIQDLKDLAEIDKLDFSPEIKEILSIYKLGLEINVKGKTLLTSLIEQDYEVFVENLRNALLIPSYFDIYKSEKERYYHVYLLGILEGRLNFYNIRSNKESGFGRYDICAIPILKNRPGLLIEIKADDSLDSSSALEQIKKNEYMTDLKIEGIQETLLLAINFTDGDIKIEYESFSFPVKDGN